MQLREIRPAGRPPARRCDSCGRPISMLKSGRCLYCGRVFNPTVKPPAQNPALPIDMMLLQAGARETKNRWVVRAVAIGLLISLMVLFVGTCMRS